MYRPPLAPLHEVQSTSDKTQVRIRNKNNAVISTTGSISKTLVQQDVETKRKRDLS